METAVSSGTFVLPDIFRLTVDYSKILEEMIFVGRYDRQDENITGKRFPIKGKGLVEFEGHYFFHFDGISSEKAIRREVKQEEENNPWSPAKIEHILAHGAAFPEEQIKYAIIGLGSVAKVGRLLRVPALSGEEFNRYLVLYRWSEKWCCICHRYRFLAVRPVSK